MVRKILWLILLGCLSVSSFAQVCIEGKIKKYAGQPVFFTRMEGKNDISDTIQVTRNGSFVYKTESAIPYKMYVGGVRTFLFLKPNASLQLEINAADERNITFSFKGDYAAENNYQQTAGSIEHLVLLLQEGKFTSFADYRKALEDANEYALKQLQAVTDPKIKEQGLKIGSWLVNMMSFRYYDWNHEKANADADFLEFVKSIDYTDTVHVDDNVISGAVNWYLDQAGLADKKERAIRYFEVAAKLIGNEKIRNKTLSAAMWTNLAGDKIPWIDEVFAAYKAVCTDEVAIKKYAAETERHLNFFRIRNGIEAPDFEVVDSVGKKVRLSDFRGKFVYIDVWATWCAPCCAEIPHVEKLHAQFSNDSRVEFISISVDSKAKVWKEKVAADKPAWKQYIADGGTSSAFYRTYAIEFIPRFMLIGPDGKIVEIDYMKPSKLGCAENLRMIIDKAFEE